MNLEQFTTYLEIRLAANETDNRISKEKIISVISLTKRVGSAASDRAAPLPTWPTQIPQTRLTTPTTMNINQRCISHTNPVGIISILSKFFKIFICL